MRKVVNVGDVKVRLVVNKEYKIMDVSQSVEEVVVYIDKKNGDVFCRFLEEEGNRYKIEKDGSIKV